VSNCRICGKPSGEVEFCPCDLDYLECRAELESNYDRWVSEFPPESRMEKAA
jgi:hypothetical protein